MDRLDSLMKELDSLSWEGIHEAKLEECSAVMHRAAEKVAAEHERVSKYNMYSSLVAEIVADQEWGCRTIDPSMVNKDVLNQFNLDYFLMWIPAIFGRPIRSSEDKDIILIGHQMYKSALDGTTFKKLLPALGTRNKGYFRCGKDIVWGTGMSQTSVFTEGYQEVAVLHSFPTKEKDSPFYENFFVPMSKIVDPMTVHRRAYWYQDTTLSKWKEEPLFKMYYAQRDNRFFD